MYLNFWTYYVYDFSESQVALLQISLSSLRLLNNNHRAHKRKRTQGSYKDFYLYPNNQVPKQKRIIKFDVSDFWTYLCI